MSIEGIAMPNRIVNQVGNRTIDVLFDPLSLCTDNELALLTEEIEAIVSDSFDGPGFTSDSLQTSVFGAKERGKVLMLVRDLRLGTLNALVSGQILNSYGSKILIKESPVFHLSLLYSSGGNTIPLWNFLVRDILAGSDDKGVYFSCFTQNPRVYSLLRSASCSEIYPTHSSNPKSESLIQMHEQLVEFLGGVNVQHGVFRKKVDGSFTSERIHSKNLSISSWFYNDLGIIPEQGDLLLLLAKVKSHE